MDLQFCNLFIFFQFVGFCVGQKVIYAVNAGGNSHVDSKGIKYLSDPLTIGVSSDYGKRQPIHRVDGQDMILYQTERWHDGPFSYEVPIKEDGDYVLVLKFAEVYFYGPNLKVFNVQLNNQHLVLQDLDIYDKVGHSTAHEEVIPLSIKKGKLSVIGQYSTFNGVLKVEMVKGAADNPKICAFYVMKGTVEDVPQLPDLEKKFQKTLESNQEEEEEDLDEDSEENFDRNEKKPSKKNEKKSKFKSGPPAANPYAEDSSSLVMPIMIAFALFIPTLLCLCRL